MNAKPKDNRVTPPSGNVSASGGGKVSVSVKDIVNSPKVQQQVKAVKELADSLSKKVA
jgi:hypothetical protein